MFAWIARPCLTLTGKAREKYAPLMGSGHESRSFFHYLTYIAHFPPKSKCYGVVKRYFRHARGLYSTPMVNISGEIQRCAWTRPTAKSVDRVIQSPPPGF